MNENDPKLLLNLLKKKDPRVKMGEIFKKEGVQLLLLKQEDDEEYSETGRAVCTACLTILSATDGSHVNRHVTQTCKKRELPKDGSDEQANGVVVKQRRITEFNSKQLSSVQKARISEAVAKFCITSGKPFNFCSSDALNNYTLDILNAVLPGYPTETKKDMPSRTTIQRNSEKLARNLVSKAFEKVAKYAGTRLNVICDHGKLVHHYLSLYGSFVDEDFKLQLVPLGFTPALDGKSIIETAKLIVKRFEEFGVPEEDVMKCRVTADGALQGLSTHFQSYIRCVNHSLNLVAHRAVFPLDSHLSKFDEEDMNTLKRVSETISAAQKVSNSIRTNVNLCASLSKLPALYVETRWLIGVKCVSDITELSEEIQTNFSGLPTIGKQAFSKLTTNDFQIANAIVYFFAEILQFCNVFQSQNAISLHLVLPTYKRLEERWKRFQRLDFE